MDQSQSNLAEWTSQYPTMRHIINAPGWRNIFRNLQPPHEEDTQWEEIITMLQPESETSTGEEQ